MAIHTLQKATLGNIEGQGFAFTRRTFRGKELQGTFFGTEENADQLEALLEKDQVRFDGVVYSKTRSGKTSKQAQSLLVNVEGLRSVRAGERVDFTVLDEV